LYGPKNNKIKYTVNVKGDESKPNKKERDAKLNLPLLLDRRGGGVCDDPTACRLEHTGPGSPAIREPGNLRPKSIEIKELISPG
jgi:hypothetical protein